MIELKRVINKILNANIFIASLFLLGKIIANSKFNEINGFNKITEDEKSTYTPKASSENNLVKNGIEQNIMN